tara:strand:+ start:1803 stop:1958 length:156 start_codon:yes stop_codon:yes gene_type:complete
MKEYILKMTKKELQQFAIQMSYEIREYQRICLDVKKFYPDVHAELIMEGEE